MHLSREIKFGLSILLGLDLLMAFSSISLLERMAPAIEIALQENVRSLKMVEQMLSSLAQQRGPASAGDREKFFAALEQARGNITEKDEAALIAAIEHSTARALSGDSGAISAVATDLERLGEVNRDAMRRSAGRGNKLRFAGAWAIAMLGFITFLAGIFIFSRFRRRIEDPIHDLLDVIMTWKEGNHHRRFHSPLAAKELGRIGAVLNGILDKAMDREFEKRQDVPADVATHTQERQIIGDLLELSKTPSFIVSNEGALMSANSEGLKLLSRKGGSEIRKQLSQAPASKEQGRVTKVQAIGSSGYCLCEVGSGPEKT